MSESARAWAETVLIPTYGVGIPEKNPMFLEKRVYQGSSGAVYPLPVIEQVADTPEPRPYTAVFLQNRYRKIMILPELGARAAFDDVLAMDPNHQGAIVHMTT